mmetsp:Transcript_8393/g.19756  ORF Transcript_8393/g.19756 Transcript_8393/m.19756 type:complete len:160 (-) Transcript_8393:102-581(-)
MSTSPRSLTYYHYTDSESARKINSEKVLHASASGAGGPGIYVTDLNPDVYSKSEILANNYGQETSANFGRADHVIRVTVGLNSWMVVKVRDHVYKIVHKQRGSIGIDVGSPRATFAEPFDRHFDRRGTGALELLRMEMRETPLHVRQRATAILRELQDL